MRASGLVCALLVAGCPADELTPCAVDVECDAGTICLDATCSPPTPATRAALDLVDVPSGPFTMGCHPDDDDRCAPAEQPQHTVTVAAFAIERQEVSARDFADFLSRQPDNLCGDGACVWTSRESMPLDSADGVMWTPKEGVGDRPMVQVSWHGAAEHCRFRGLELCSEAQWEKAARGGCELHAGDCATATPRFPWGDTDPDCTKAHMDDGTGVGCGTDATVTVDALSAGASPYGALNMAGNVWEWVADWHHDSFDGAPTDGTAWTDPASSWRVFKGGGARSDRQHLRGAARGNGGPDDGNEFRGFRCCQGL